MHPLKESSAVSPHLFSPFQTHSLGNCSVQPIQGSYYENVPAIPPKPKSFSQDPPAIPPRLKSLSQDPPPIPPKPRSSSAAGYQSACTVPPQVYENVPAIPPRLKSSSQRYQDPPPIPPKPSSQGPQNLPAVSPKSSSSEGLTCAPAIPPRSKSVSLQGSQSAPAIPPRQNSSSERGGYQSVPAIPPRLNSFSQGSQSVPSNPRRRISSSPPQSSSECAPVVPPRTKQSSQGSKKAQTSPTTKLYAIEYPAHWEHQRDKFLLVLVDHISSEWTEISALFNKTMSRSSVRVKSIHRIQNQWLWEKYAFSKERMSEKNNGVVNERQLFHGTGRTPPEDIFKSEHGFDFRYASQGMWGTGTYFAVNARYSDRYAYSSSTTKQLIVANVLTGISCFCRPDETLKKPPVIETAANSNATFVKKRYDSVSGFTKGSGVVVIYDHDKAYPAYLITYHH